MLSERLQRSPRLLPRFHVATSFGIDLRRLLQYVLHLSLTYRS